MTPAAARRIATGNGARERLVGVGSSAGGPAALVSLLSGLPKAFPAAIVVIQLLPCKSPLRVRPS